MYNFMFINYSKTIVKTKFSRAMRDEKLFEKILQFHFDKKNVDIKNSDLYTYSTTDS